MFVCCNRSHAYVFLLLQATSSLDNETEQSVQESLQVLNGQNRTLIVIAHRLSTIQDADVICVLEDGAVVESGSHWELINRPGGRYSELVAKMRMAQPVVEGEEEKVVEKEGEEKKPM